METRREGTLQGGNKCRRATSAGSRGGGEAGGSKGSHLERRLIILLGPSMAPAGDEKGQVAHV